jgi:hypothetical protein
MNTANHTHRGKATLVLLVLVIGLIGRWASAQDYAIDWHTIDGGGAGPANASTGGTYALSATIGQPDARNHPQAMTGGSYKLTGGFWVIPECPAIPADYDGDCDVDQADYQVFESCATAPGVSLSAGCDSRDFDSDGDVDQSDFAVFQRCLSGPDVPADPNCTD